MIGVLELFDTVLRPWIYSVVGLLLAATFVSPLRVATRDGGLAAVTAALAYVSRSPDLLPRLEPDPSR